MLPTPEGPSRKTSKVHPTEQIQGSLSCICFFYVKDKMHILALEISNECPEGQV